MKSCPVTGVSDPRFLKAFYIKPNNKCNDDEKEDMINNGLLFTLTIGDLFERGFITFTDNKKIKVSTYIDRDDADALNLKDGVELPGLIIEGKAQYLKYHRENIFLDV